MRADVHDDEDIHDERISILRARFDFRRLSKTLSRKVSALSLVMKRRTRKTVMLKSKNPLITSEMRLKALMSACVQEREGKMLAAIDQVKTWDESFEHIHEVDEGIGDETEEQSHVNRAQELVRALKMVCWNRTVNRGFDETARNILQLRRRSSLADRVDDGLEAMNREPRRCQTPA